MKQEKPNQPMAGKRSRSDDHASSTTANGNSSSAASARQDGEPKAGGNARDVERNENAIDFFKNRFKRHNPSKNIASGSESAARGGGFTPIAEALTPAEASLLKALNSDVAGGNGGVAGLSGLDRLMRVMINAPDREARALCLELLIRSKDDADVMKGFVERRGLTFIKGWLAEETTSVAMIKLLLSVAKVLPVTYSSLKQSDAGRALKALYKHADPGVKKQAKAVIAHWKNELVRDEGEIAKHREKLDALHDGIKAKQAAAKKAKDDAEKAEKLKRGAIRAQNKPPNGTEAPTIISAPPPPLLYTRSSSNNSIDSDPGAPVPSKTVARAGMFDDDPLAAIGAPGAASGLGTTTGGSVAGTGSARLFPGRKFPTRGTRGRGAAAIGAGSGRGSRGSVLRGGGGVAAGRSSATAATAAAAAPAPAGRSGGILKVTATPSPSKEEGIGAGEVIGVVGETDNKPAQAPASVAVTTTATAAPATKVADSGTGAGEAVSLVATAPAPAKAPAPAPASAEGSSDIAIPAGGGVAVQSAPGPPPIVSLDEMARADAAEKKRKRKARPAGKKVGWADRAGKILQIVKEFHPEDAALVVSEEPQEETPGANEAAALLQHPQHHHHKHWAERVKREREMERKFHGKSGGRVRRPHEGSGTGGEDEGAGPGARGVELAAASRRRTMMPTVSWRRPGLYQKGVVHEFVMTLEVESSEAEGQAARTRAGLEVVYLSSGDIPPSPAEPDAASFLPADGTHSSPYEIPFYMEAELEQMQADQEQEKEQQHQERQRNSPSPPPPRLTYEQMKALEAALATVDPHAAAALRSRFSQEPRLLQALLATEGQVNTVLLRSLCQQALSTPSNVPLTLPPLPTTTAGASPTGQQQQQSTLRASPSPAAVPAAVAGTPYPHQPQLPPPPPPRLAQTVAPGAAVAGSFDAPGAMVSQTPQGVVAGAVVPPAVPQQANTFGAASPAAGAPSVILGVPQHLPPPPPPPPPAAFAAPAAGPHQAVPIQPNAPPHPPAYFGVQTPGAVAAPAAPQGMGLPPNPPPPVLYHQQQQPQQQQMVPPGMPGPAPGPGPGGQAGPPLGIEAGGGGPGFGHEGARDGWEGGGGRGIGGGRKERDGDRGRRMVKPIFCRYHNAKVQMCTNDPCRFIHDLTHYPDEHRPRVRSYGGFANRDRDSGDRERERDWDRRDRGGRDWERRDRRDRGEREERTSERDGRDGDGGEETGDGRDTGRGGRGRGGGGLDGRDRSDGRGSDDKRARYR